MTPKCSTSFYLAALCRKLTATESKKLLQYVSEAEGPARRVGGCVVALLNSKEFLLAVSGAPARPSKTAGTAGPASKAFLLRR